MNWVVKLACFVACVTVGISAYPRSLRADDSEVLQKCRKEWNEFLLEKCAIDQTERAVREHMDKKYSEIYSVRANDELYGLVFVVDDFHQIEFTFNSKSQLLFTPTIEHRSKWLRFPNGKAIAVQDPNEAALRAKAERVAIEYVANHTEHKQDILEAHGKRSVNNGTWDIGVTFNNRQVAAPHYSLEVTDDGKVRETRPIARQKGK